MQIVFDNENICDDCKSLWGFSAYFKDYKLLFDTGSNGRVLLKNMEILGVDVAEIKYLFITHSHWDHIGGIDSIIELNPNIILFIPSSLSKYLIKDLKSMVKEVVICDDKPMKLFNNCYTTGILGSEMPEQSIIFDNKDKTTLVTGCGHFGIENITKVAKDFLRKNIDCVMGGFHLVKSDDEKIYNTITELKNMGVTCAKPTHCSGKRAIELFNQEIFSIYGDREKCYKCYRPKSSCMCKYIKPFDTNTKFVILMHPKEFKKVKNNTGHFTHQSLKNSELFIGVDFSNHNRINEIISTHNSYILFPSEDAINLSRETPTNIKDDRDIAIFLIDSTWACTKKMFTQSKNLQRLSHMSFETSRISQYKIKQQPQENYLSTIESTLVVLELLDKIKIEDIKQENLDNFLNPFLNMIKYQQNLISNPLSNAVRFKPKRS